MVLWLAVKLPDFYRERESCECPRSSRRARGERPSPLTNGSSAMAARKRKWPAARSLHGGQSRTSTSPAALRLPRLRTSEGAGAVGCLPHGQRRMEGPDLRHGVPERPGTDGHLQRNWLGGGETGNVNLRGIRSLWSRPWNIELAADTAHRAFLHFPVPRHRSDLAIRRILPERMVPALSFQMPALVPQIPFKIIVLHAGASSKRCRTLPGAGLRFRASSRW
jgi:hypothetical protein